MDPTHPTPPEAQNQKIAPEKNGAPATAPAPNGPRITATEFAEQLGISMDVLKKIRAGKLQPHVDWLLPANGQPIVYTLTGVAKVRAALGLLDPEEGADAGTAADAPSEPPARRNGPNPPTPEPAKKDTARVTLIVSRPARGNTRIVLCFVAMDSGGAIPPDAREVRLQVKSNANFCKGMRVPRCVRSSMATDLYTYEGRLPRFKGRF